MKRVYAKLFGLLGLTCLIILCCSCRSEVSDAYRLHVVILQSSGTPSPPDIFEWQSSVTHNHTFPDLPIALPSVAEFAVATNRQDIGLLSLHPQVVRRGKCEAKRLGYNARGVFIIKGVPYHPALKSGEMEGEFIAEVVMLEKDSVRVRFRYQGSVSMIQEQGLKAVSVYPVDQDVEMDLPLSEWVVCRYLDYDGYKPLALKLVAYRLMRIEERRNWGQPLTINFTTTIDHAIVRAWQDT